MASASPPHTSIHHMLDEAVEAEIELEHESTVAEAERGLIRRAARVLAGAVLVVVGLFLLVLPGPGLVVIALGLGLMSRDVPFARRWLRLVRARIPATDDGEVAAWVIVVSVLMLMASVGGSVGWLVFR
jgi:Putative transmembrane protein (PGPGW)